MRSSRARAGRAYLPAVRQQSDTPWFRSWLLFDPIAQMKKISQPVLIVQGSLDQQVFAESADRLAAASSARKKPASYTTKVLVPGVNHLLVPATTGEPDEYASLTDHTVSPAVSSAIVDWLTKTIGAAAIRK